MTTKTALDFLSARKPPEITPVCAVFGDEPFLKRLALLELRRRVLSEEDAGFSLATFAGKTAELRDVLDELSTVALFGGPQRLVVVEDADDFVKQHRGALEKYVAAPRGPGVLVLEVRSWGKNTKLFKALDKSGLQIDCSAPSHGKLLKWLVAWAKRRHGAELQPAAAELMIELTGPELGLLDQETAKLAAYAGEEPVTPEMVHELVGGWRTKTTWEMLDAAAEGDAAEALAQLDRLLGAGEHPLAILGPTGYALRRFAAATRAVELAESAGRRVAVGDALRHVGIQQWAVEKSQAQLRQLGRRRGAKLYGWLLEADLDLKGRSRLSPRTVLERLIVRMSKAARPAS